jgi:hypothetical protein
MWSWINLFLNFISLHFIFISYILLIILIVIFSCSYPFFNWNYFSIAYLMIWFYFFVSNLILFLSKSIFFKSLMFFKFVFSSLFLIILVGWEFHIVVFSGLTFILWSNFMIRVTGSEDWIELTPVVFYYFLKFYPSSLRQIDILCFF